nr:sigma-54 dependent transcriptional regulator [Gemmatimonadota bacterium]
SVRLDKPFIRVNCAAIPRDLVESEMFGHERGAFTGATQTRIGRFELANTGTLFLDEIGDLSLEAQAKLLRAIEVKEIQRVGGNRNVKADARIIAATNHDLGRAVREGLFREDLFFRLSVIPLALPPLREREGDVPLLVQHFSLLHFKRTGQLPPAWNPEALAVLERHRWPGNIRELANIVERIAIVHPGELIPASRVQNLLSTTRDVSMEASLPDHAVSSGAGTAGDPDGVALVDALDEFERRTISHALRRANGNVAEAARRLQTDRPNLYRRMKRLGIDGVRSPAAPATHDPQ